jgi:hypothetical protein
MTTRKKATHCLASSFTSCSGRQESKEYCLKHYQQVRKNGKPVVTRFDRRPAVIEGNTARIPLGIGAKDGFTLVDKKDAWVEKHNWSLSSIGYAQTNLNGSMVLLHTFLLGKKAGKEIDHININRLDNRRKNLRHVTHNENMYNLPLASNNKSGVRGVDFDKRKNKWRAQIQKNSNNIFIGYFDSLEKAKLARQTKEAELFVIT